ncbi:MAG: HAD family hydrolase [Actinomycetota bacterium]
MAGAAFFDLDKTVIAKSSTLAFSKPLFQAGLLTRASLLKAATAQAYFQMFGADHDQLDRVRQELGELTRGWKQDEILGLVEEAVEEIVAPLVYAEALALIAEHSRVGRQVVVVSSSPLEIVQPLCHYLGLTEIIATLPEVDEEGRYTGGIDFYAYGPGKAEAIREWAARHDVSLAESFAYSDSATDLPMLETVGHPVAVNPDRDLRAIAEERDWQILEFRREVEVRSTPRPVPVISGAVAGGLAAALAVWAVRRARR